MYCGTVVVSQGSTELVVHPLWPCKIGENKPPVAGWRVLDARQRERRGELHEPVLCCSRRSVRKVGDFPKTCGENNRGRLPVQDVCRRQMQKGTGRQRSGMHLLGKMHLQVDCTLFGWHGMHDFSRCLCVWPIIGQRDPHRVIGLFLFTTSVLIACHRQDLAPQFSSPSLCSLDMELVLPKLGVAENRLFSMPECLSVSTSPWHTLANALQSRIHMLVFTKGRVR